MTLRVRPEARDDMLDAARWYAERSKELGQDFIAQAEATFRRIEQGPARYRLAYGRIRKALTLRFPYAVYYAQEDDDIVVFAVLHQRRSDDFLKDRLIDRS